MLPVSSIVILLLSLFTGFAAARNGCRQCDGSLNLVFKNYLTLYEVNTYLAGTIGRCATAKQYELRRMSEKECINDATEYACKTWTLGIKAWRYCGNGGKVLVRRDNVCIGNLCAGMEQLVMRCTKSVDCAEKCDCDECGC